MQYHTSDVPVDEFAVHVFECIKTALGHSCGSALKDVAGGVLFLPATH